MNFAVKSLLTIVAAVVLAVFIWFVLRDVMRSLRVRRSARCKQLPSPVRVEYGTRESPSWERQDDWPRVRSLQAKLKELGE